MKKQIKRTSTYLLLGLMFATAACGKVSGTIGGKKNRTPVYSLEDAAGSEIVSSSKQSTLTLGGYKVQSLDGNTLDKLDPATSGGQKVQMTVQGVILE